MVVCDVEFEAASCYAVLMYMQPAEWSAHRACWLAWPSHENLWQEDLPVAQEEFTALCRLIAEGGESLEILVPTPKARLDAERSLKGLPVRFHDIGFGDIWLRDTAPIFLKKGSTKLAARFIFNGWGGKYVLPHDAEVSANVARASGIEARANDWVLEGGSVEVDGEGTCLTTRQCLLNENRNPKLGQTEIESRLKTGLGVEKILWLGDGLLNDHTDGHIDTIARFVAPGKVVCMKAPSTDDPNHEILEKIASDLAAMTDAKGRKLEVIRIPSPGQVFDEEGELMPASFVNFYIANKTVAVPVYGTPYDAEAVTAIARCFPGRKTVGLQAKAILTGGGAFHCITQQEPV
jgi:agmatine deiminase